MEMLNAACDRVLEPLTKCRLPQRISMVRSFLEGGHLPTCEELFEELKLEHSEEDSDG
jgi:hypothetical protein